MRIVSLLPSATETLCALGLEQEIVGISHKCDFPAQIDDRPRVTKSLLREDLPSAEIHRRVQEGAAGRTQLYELDRQLLTELQPDVVVTQDQCSVCAVGKSDVEDALKATGCRASVVILRATHFSDVMRDIATLGSATGREEAAAVLVSRMRARLTEIRRRTNQARRPRVFCLSWFNPLMAASHWMSDIVGHAGGVDELGVPGASLLLNRDRLLSYDPETIFLMPCDFGLERTAHEWQEDSVQAVCRDLNAVRNERVFAVKGSLFHRPGPRLLDGIELLASVLHPLRIRRGQWKDEIRKVA